MNSVVSFVEKLVAYPQYSGHLLCCLPSILPFLLVVIETPSS